MALTAVPEINNSAWFTANLFKFNGLTAVNGYAPFAIFCEGFASTPRAEIVDYEWDFGDSSPVVHGFNAAHVYTTADTFTVTLTVTDINGDTDDATVEVTVMARDGATYYVSEAGDDDNDGLTDLTPWKTANKAFAGMTNGRYGPGDIILFNKGDTFDMSTGLVSPDSFQAIGYGYMFGVYGSGAAPEIKNISGTGRFITMGTNCGTAHIVFSGLNFDCQTTGGQKGSVLNAIGRACEHLLFYQCTFDGCAEIMLANGGATNNSAGFFIVECTGNASTAIQLFIRTERFAMVDSAFYYSGNHTCYASYVDRGVIVGNTLAYPAFGRTALRLCNRADDYDYPTNNVQVSENTFRGFIDPVIGGEAHDGGTRYNYQLIEFSPNGPWIQSMEYVMFERNLVQNAETMMCIADCDDLTIRNNIFIGKSTYSSPKIKIGRTDWELKPNLRINIINNTFACLGSAVGTNAVIGIYTYAGPLYDGSTQHEDIVIKNNIVYVPSSKSRMIFLDSATPVAALTSDNNLYYAPSTGTVLFQVGGNYQGGGTKYSLADWRTYSGEDANSVYGDPAFTDILGADNEFASLVYDEDLTLTAASPAIDAGADLTIIPYDYALTARPDGAHHDIGAYESADAYVPAVNLTLFIEVFGSGTVTPDDPGPYEPDDVVELTAAAAAGWAFVEWSGDLTGSNAVQNITLTASKTVSAHFVQVEA